MTQAAGTGRDWLRDPVNVVVLVLAVVGAVLLLVIMATFWLFPGDSFAYWLAGMRLWAGQPIYEAGEAAYQAGNYPYHYTPPLAQVLAPFTPVVPAVVYLAAYRAVYVLAVWELAGRRFLWMLALIAFIPVAVELRFENVHLFMALIVVYGLTRWPWLFALGAIVKISPGLGIVYLALRRRWRDALIASIVGLAICAVSYVLDPSLWRAFYDTVIGEAGVTGNSLIPLPYLVRACIGLALTVAGGVVGRRRGELLLVAGVTIANPNLALSGFAVLAAAVPIWRSGPGGLEARTRGDAGA